MKVGNVIDWLLDVDPAIRFQTMRDLHCLSPKDTDPERERIVSEGWAKSLLRLIVSL